MSDLLGDFAGALDQLFLCEGVVGAALQGSGFGHQARATETQVTHLLFNVRANLGTERRHSALEGLEELVESWRGVADWTHFVVLGSHGCVFGLVGQVAKLIGQFVGQSSEVVRVGVRLGHLREEEKIQELTKVRRLGE